jgi:hypothetical protein
MAASPPPIGLRFAYRRRPDKTELCCIRTDRRFYEFEFFNEHGAWWRLAGYATSLAEAIRQMDRLATATGEAWTYSCRNMKPSPTPLRGL